MSTALTSLSNDLAAAVERAGKYVVGVHGHPRLPASGILWKPGVIVTAEHALRRDDEVRVTMPDGKTATATVAGRDPGTDVAVLKLDHTVAAEIGEQPKTGSIALAVGRTHNTGVSATMGVVSGVGGEWNTWRGGRLDTFIRLDLRLYPGLSGAAVIDASGKLTGMATAGLSRSSPLSIATPIVERIAKDLLEKGRVTRGYIGIGLQPVSLPQHLNIEGGRGLIILSVEPEAGGAKAGLVIGDILVAIDGKAITDTDDLQAALGPGTVGKTLRASILRAGAPKDVDIVVGEKPSKRG